MEDKIDEINLSSIPLKALQPKTRWIIVNALNKRRVLPSDEGLPKDYRGLACLAKLPEPWVDKDNPTLSLLEDWERDPASRLGHLEDFLQQLDRWDVVEDIYEAIRADAKAFEHYQAKDNCVRIEPQPNDQITYDDLIHCSLPPKRYDALLLYADEDREFANEVLEELTNSNLQICHRDDLVAGYLCEYSGIMQLIEKRCCHVVVILSENFINSRMNKFLVELTQYVAIENGRRIILPIIYEYNLKRIPLPLELVNIHKLDYNRREEKAYNFWGKLTASVAGPRVSQHLSDVEISIINTGSSKVNISEEISSGESSSTLLAGCADSGVFSGV